MTTTETKTNPLEELAERMRKYISEAAPNWSFRDDATKAQRIVAELAKVENPPELRTVGLTHLSDILEADRKRAVEIMRNCREIAEEGVEDGK